MSSILSQEEEEEEQEILRMMIMSTDEPLQPAQEDDNDEQHHALVQEDMIFSSSSSGSLSSESCSFHILSIPPPVVDSVAATAALPGPERRFTGICQDLFRRRRRRPGVGVGVGVALVSVLALLFLLLLLLSFQIISLEESSVSKQLEETCKFWLNETNERLAQQTTALARLSLLVVGATGEPSFSSSSFPWSKLVWNETTFGITNYTYTYGYSGSSSGSSRSSSNQQEQQQERGRGRRPGSRLAQEGASAKYPVVIIPGFVTSGLEVWQGKECLQKQPPSYFRQRLWGGLLDSAKTIFLDKQCWRDHLALDPSTGLDPPNIRLRASEGFGGADYFMGSYWVWDKLLRNLADLGYDSSNMAMETYDWRLSFPLLEERDGYLTKLRYKIEGMHKASGNKVVLASHSMGSMLVHYFMKWVTTPESLGGGGGGRDWIQVHVHTYVNIAGSHLGVPKAASALLSGEMKDTAMMGRMASDVTEQFFGRRLRKELWNTWGSLWGMLPKGAERLWDIGADLCLHHHHRHENELSHPASDPFCSYYYDHQQPSAPFIVLPENKRHHRDSSSSSLLPAALDKDDKDVLFLSSSLVWGPQNMSRRYSHSNAKVEEFASYGQHSTASALDLLYSWGQERGLVSAGAAVATASAESSTSGKLFSNHNHHNKNKYTWLDPTTTPLPKAPDLKIYCLYGVGVESDRGFMYRSNHAHQDDSPQPQQQQRGDNLLPFVLDTQTSQADHNIKNGIRFTDGDGSVPLLSLGYMCVDAWSRPSSGLNPSKIPVITREYLHRPKLMVDDLMRGGPESADHVDILGHVGMTEDFLRIVTDFHPPNQENRIVSRIQEIAQAINEHPQGGLFRNPKKKKKKASNDKRGQLSL